jgi:chorismate dehydratase
MVDTWGMIDYLNLVPLACELKQKVAIAMCPTPAVLNALFAARHVSYAPCSSVCLLDGNQLLAPVGVAADGPVKSVYLAVQRRIDPADVRVRFSSASATSVILAKLLLNAWNWQWRVDDRDPDVELIIGDEALQKKEQFAEVLDLGLEWKSWTGLPFVFAAWQCKTQSPAAAMFLEEAAAKAEIGMRQDPELYLRAIKRQVAVPHDIIVDYWQTITYTLSASHLQGLELFLTKARQLAVPTNLSPAIATVPELLH